MAAVSSSCPVVAWKCGACGVVVFLSDRPLHCGKCDRRNSYAIAPDVAAPTGRRARKWPPGAQAPPGSTTGRTNAPAAGTTEGPSNGPQDEDRSFRWGSEVEPEHCERATSGWEPWARVTCELARKRLTLFGGPRGTGKTRTMLTVARGIIRTMRRPVIYFAADGQSLGELRANAEELGLEDELGLLALVAGPNLETLAEVAREIRPALMVIDALKPSHIRGVRCTSDSTAERAALELLLGVDPHRAGGLSDECDSAVVAMLHMHSDQRDFAVGGQVQQACSVVVRIDPLETKEHELPKLKLSIANKNRFQRGRRRSALLTLTEPDGRLVPHPEDKP